jgi:hypothetical protein
VIELRRGLHGARFVGGIAKVVHGVLPRAAPLS